MVNKNMAARTIENCPNVRKDQIIVNVDVDLPNYYLTLVNEAVETAAADGGAAVENLPIQL